MTAYFAVAPAPITGEKIIATADNGRVVATNNELHIETTERHYIYKHDDAPVGWYMKNTETSVEHYIGEGASPTAEFTNIVITDAATWEAILQPEMPDELPTDSTEE